MRTEDGNFVLSIKNVIIASLSIQFSFVAVVL